MGRACLLCTCRRRHTLGEGGGGVRDEPPTTRRSAAARLVSLRPSSGFCLLFEQGSCVGGCLQVGEVAEQMRTRG